MARQLRVEFPGAFYHVFSRGNQKHAIFQSDEDRYCFLKILGDAYKRFGIAFHAYCLMPNHYHLLAETVYGMLSKAMHLINTTYTVYFNKKTDRCGHLFQGRFKSILVEAESYATELSRYIHLNPVRARLAGHPGEYPWSSYSEYAGIREPYPWLKTSLILGADGVQAEKRRKHYEGYVLEAIGHESPKEILESARSGILGRPEFVARIKTDFLGAQLHDPDREHPQLRVLRGRPGISDILDTTTEILGLHSRLTKGVAIYISHQVFGHTLESIGAFFNMSVSGICHVRHRIESEMEHNKTLSHSVEEIIIASCRQDGVKPTLL